MMLHGEWRIPRTKIVIRINALQLSSVERLRADAAIRHLWPGLIPIPHRSCPKA